MDEFTYIPRPQHIRNQPTHLMIKALHQTARFTIMLITLRVWLIPIAHFDILTEDATKKCISLSCNKPRKKKLLFENVHRIYNADLYRVCAYIYSPIFVHLGTLIYIGKLYTPNHATRSNTEAHHKLLGV